MTFARDLFIITVVLSTLASILLILIGGFKPQVQQYKN